METIQNIKKIALGFFLAFGAAHITTGVLIANELYLKNATLINKILDIPFIITGLIYGLSSIRLSLTDPEKNHKVMDTLFIILVSLTLIGLLVINLAVPNLNA